MARKGQRWGRNPGPSYNPRCFTSCSSLKGTALSSDLLSSCSPWSRQVQGPLYPEKALTSHKQRIYLSPHSPPPLPFPSLLICSLSFLFLSSSAGPLSLSLSSLSVSVFSVTFSQFVSLSPSLHPLCLSHIHTPPHSDPESPGIPSLCPVCALIPCNTFSLLSRILPFSSAGLLSPYPHCFQGLFWQLCLCFYLLFFSSALISLPPFTVCSPGTCPVPSPHPIPVRASACSAIRQDGRCWSEGTLYHLCCEQRC